MNSLTCQIEAIRRYLLEHAFPAEAYRFYATLFRDIGDELKGVAEYEAEVEAQAKREGHDDCA